MPDRNTSRRVTLLLAASLAWGAATAAADTLSDAVRAMPANSWQKINLNRFDDVWTPPDQRPTTASPESNISAWSGATWDERRRQLLIWGGDIGNEEGNEVYQFDATSGVWRRGSLPSDVTLSNGIPTTVDGVFSAPTSGESWDNVVYLQNLDRMAVMAVSREGITFRRTDGQATGPYFWDPSKADPNKVSGATGSQVKPSVYPGVLGGQMWQNRNNFPADVNLGLMGKTAYVNENGKDVVYFAGNYDNLWRYTARDLNPANDTWEHVGIRTISGLDSPGAMAYDPTRKILVKPLTATTYGYWDVSDAAIARFENRQMEVVPAILSEQITGDARLYGLQYDPTLQAFVLWGGDASVWVLRPPANLDSNGDGIKDVVTGWTLEKLAPTGVGPTLPARFTGVFGKWVYLPLEKAYMGVIDPDSGDVFVYKPAYNVATADTTPPTIQPNVTGTVGNAGWYRSNVSWSWTVADAESAIKSSTGCGTGSLTTDSLGQTITCSASSDGGTASQSITVRRDATAPTAAATPAALPNGAGWYRSSVTIRTTGTDATSGIDTCSADSSIATEGRNQSSAPSTCTDRAGNVSASVTAGGINIDRTAPQVTAARSPLPNAAGWNNTRVTVSYSAVDALSGVAATGCDAPVTLQATGDDQSVTGRCTDVAGNVGSATVSVIRIDMTPPVAVATASPLPNANGWNNTAVTVSFTGTDSLPGSSLASCDAPLSFATEGSGISASGTCRDVAANVSAPATLTLNIDQTPPTATITTPASGAIYQTGASVAAAFQCADARSGVADCAGSVANGMALDTSSAGTKTFTVTVTDKAGNTTTFNVSYVVSDSGPTSPPPTPTPRPTSNQGGGGSTGLALVLLLGGLGALRKRQATA